MRAVIVLHLFYTDIALELVTRVARLNGGPDVIVTTPVPLNPETSEALDRLSSTVEVVTVENRGWDIGPLFSVMPLIRERGYDLVCKLHTKRGNSGYAAEWRRLCYEALIASSSQVAGIVDLFASTPALELLGPAALYKSSAAHQFRNAEILSKLAPSLMAPGWPPADWGFFAGTMFWARTTMLERLAPFADFQHHHAHNVNDGAHAHAIERLFGLAPLRNSGKIGLVNRDGSIEVSDAPGGPSPEPIIQTLVAEAGLSKGPIDDQLAALITAHNPLVDYLRHGRDPDALDPNLYFSSTWYNRIHPDVFAAGVHPLSHYVSHGAAEGRSTGPLFDGQYYRTAYPDVALAGGDPLRHFLERGVAEQRVAIPVSKPQHELPGERPRRFYRQFDIAREQKFLSRQSQVPAGLRDHARRTLVSVIMPVFNRRDTVTTAIASVLGQTHDNFELIIVDDGSTDGTDEAVVSLLGDSRIRLVRGMHGGVSAARNRGLAEAQGEFVAYLDSDNRWQAWFLEVMTLFMLSEGLDAAYSGIALRDDLGHLTGYRGDDFEWEACLQQNYVDLNAFCHARRLVDELGGFDSHLRRMVDWDLILRYGRDRIVGYAPFVGCDYFDGKADPGRITINEPAAFQKLVWTKNRYGLHTGTPAFAEQVRLSFAIKIAAPENERAAWGDFHFADSLCQALRRLGHKAQIDFRGQWYARSVADEDVVIVLRGLIAYEPRPGQMTFLWNISHPDQVDFAEYDRFTRIYVPSVSWAELLDKLVRPPVTPLPQAVDLTRFRPIDNAPAGPDILFCGNSRGVERDIIRWTLDAELVPEIHGGGWNGLVPDELVKTDNVENELLGALYAGAGVVLNDHWPSMRSFGFISNRLFDVVASGGRAVSDPVPSMQAVLGNAVHQVSGPAALRTTVEALLSQPRDQPSENAAAEAVRSEHSFDARARRFVEDAFSTLGLDTPAKAPARRSRDLRLRVHILAHHSVHGPQSSAFIRLLAPLTDDSVAGRLSVSLGSTEQAVPPCDICIVQRTAVPTMQAADSLVATLSAIGAALVVDVDDAFSLIGPDHPEEDIYRPLAAVLERLMRGAEECWFSTPALRDVYAGAFRSARVVPNRLDPRFWRDWRRPAFAPLIGDTVRMLYMGTHTHGGDFGLIRPALERVVEHRPGGVEVTVIGVAHEIAPAPWLRRLSPPAEAITYPRFVRWLRNQGPFDVGLAPLADTAFNRAKSDIKFLDYSALGLLSVVSAGPAYASAGEMAVQVGGSEDNWHQALNSIVDDPATYRARAAAAADYVWEGRPIGAGAEALADRIEALLKARRG